MTAGPGYEVQPPAAGTVDARGTANLADILERVLDKGIVIAGDIRVNLLDIELLTVRVRLLVASVDKARELGIDWWEHDRFLSGSNEQAIEERLERIERALGVGDRQAAADHDDARDG